MMNKDQSKELQVLLQKKLRKYTSHESSSVTYDKAKQIMGSILYSINDVSSAISNKTNNSLLGDLSIEERYELGYLENQRILEETKNLFKVIEKNFKSYGLTVYYETLIMGIPEFFKWYDLEFDAENHILTLDYPLLMNINDGNGIILIKEYLNRIRLEQVYLGTKNEETVLKSLLSYNVEYDYLIINISTLILRNSIVCILIGKEDHSSTLSDMDLEVLRRLVNSTPDKIFMNKLDECLRIEISSCCDFKESLYTYFSKYLNELANELRFYSKENLLRTMFPDHISDVEDDKYFIEGKMMCDKELMDLINEINSYNDIEVKKDIIMKRVTNVQDFIEILKECFIESEYNEVLILLSANEREYLDELYRTCLLHFE